MTTQAVAVRSRHGQRKTPTTSPPSSSGHGKHSGGVYCHSHVGHWRNALRTRIFLVYLVSAQVLMNNST